MSGREPERGRPPGAVTFLLNALFLVAILYAVDLQFRTWSNYRLHRVGQWTTWGAERAWRGAHRWWRQTSPWYQELREQERPLP